MIDRKRSGHRENQPNTNNKAKKRKVENHLSLKTADLLQKENKYPPKRAIRNWL